MIRHILLFALAIALPLALLAPLRAVRSWQPRVLELPHNSNVKLGQNYVSDFFWKPSGLLVSRTASSEAWKKPISLTNWNGQSWPVRTVEAQNASLDGKGEMAALLLEKQGLITLELRDIRTGQNHKDASDHINAHYVSRRPLQKFSDCVISPDGQSVACNNFTPDARGIVNIANTLTGQHLTRIKITSRRTGKTSRWFLGKQGINVLNVLAWAPDNQHLAIIDPDKVRVADTQTGRVLRSWDNLNRATNASWSPDGKYLALYWGHPLQFIAKPGA